MNDEDATQELRRSILLAIAVVLTYVVVGALAGVIWEWLWSPPTQVVQQHQLYYTDYGSLRRVFTGTGLYALVAAVASALVALAAALLTRRHELLTLGAVIVGSLAAAYTMHAVGVALGPPDPAKLAAVAADGTHVSGQLEVNGKTPLPGVADGLAVRPVPGVLRRTGRPVAAASVATRRPNPRKRTCRSPRRDRLPRHAPSGADITGSTTMSDQQPPAGTPEYLDSAAGDSVAASDPTEGEAPTGRRSRRTTWLVGGGVVGAAGRRWRRVGRDRPSSSRAPSPPRRFRRPPSPTRASTSTPAAARRSTRSGP